MPPKNKLFPEQQKPRKPGRPKKIFEKQLTANEIYVKRGSIKAKIQEAHAPPDDWGLWRCIFEELAEQDRFSRSQGFELTWEVEPHKIHIILEGIFGGVYETTIWPGFYQNSHFFKQLLTQARRELASRCS